MKGDSLLQLRLLLLGRPAAGAGHARVSRAVEDVVPVLRALPERGPAVGVVVVGGGGTRGGGGDVVLERAEVVEEVGYAGLPEGVYCLRSMMSLGSGWGVGVGTGAVTYVRP